MLDHRLRAEQHAVEALPLEQQLNRDTLGRKPLRQLAGRLADFRSELLFSHRLLPWHPETRVG